MLFLWACVRFERGVFGAARWVESVGAFALSLVSLSWVRLPRFSSFNRMGVAVCVVAAGAREKRVWGRRDDDRHVSAAGSRFLPFRSLLSRLSSHSAPQFLPARRPPRRARSHSTHSPVRTPVHTPRACAAHTHTLSAQTMSSALGAASPSLARLQQRRPVIRCVC